MMLTLEADLQSQTSPVTAGEALWFQRYAIKLTLITSIRLMDTISAASNLDVFSSFYLKLRSVTLSYRLNLKNLPVKNAQIFISATNLFTITKYPGSEPETSDDPYSVSGGFMDTGTYPATRTFLFGLKAAFWKNTYLFGDWPVIRRLPTSHLKIPNSNGYDSICGSNRYTITFYIASTYWAPPWILFMNLTTAIWLTWPRI